MLENPLVIQLGTLAVASLPISVILTKKIHNVFARHETKLAKTTAICTNTINSLTKKNLAVHVLEFNNFRAYINENSKLINIENVEKKEKISIEKVYLKKDQHIQLMAITSHLCHYRKIQEIEDEITSFLKKCGFNHSKVDNEYEILEKIKTNKKKKISTTIARNYQTKDIFAFNKGNAHKILERCKRVLINGKKVKITPYMRKKLKIKIKRLTQKGEKIIAFSYKALPMKKFEKYSEEFTENDLVFLGTIGLRNPLNTAHKPYIEKLNKVGIKTYILTGLKERKAAAIGIELGIVNSQYFETFSGNDIKDFNDEKIEKMINNKEKDFVFGKLRKEDKKRITKIIAKQNTVTSINIQKDITFKKIFKGIEKSRIYKENYRKILQHSLTLKIVEITLILTSIILQTPLPITIPVILIIEIFINTPLELALKADKPEINLMTENYDPKMHKISKPKLLINGITISIFLTAIYIFNEMKFGWSYNSAFQISEIGIMRTTSFIFILLAITQVLMSYTLRTHYKSILKSAPLANPRIIAATILSAITIYALSNTIIFQKYIHIGGINKFEWQIIGFTVIIFLILSEIRKFVFRKTRK